MPKLLLHIKGNPFGKNNLHWLLDVVFREDESRISNERAALNFLRFRKMYVSLLTKDKAKMSMRRKMLRNWAGPENILNSLGL
jgi:hypothetical protein